MSRRARHPDRREGFRPGGARRAGSQSCPARGPGTRRRAKRVERVLASLGDVYLHIDVDIINGEDLPGLKFPAAAGRPSRLWSSVWPDRRGSAADCGLHACAWTAERIGEESTRRAITRLAAVIGADLRWPTEVIDRFRERAPPVLLIRDSATLAQGRRGDRHGPARDELDRRGGVEKRARGWGTCSLRLAVPTQRGGVDVEGRGARRRSARPRSARPVRCPFCWSRGSPPLPACADV